MSEAPTLATYDDVASYLQDERLDFYATRQALEVATSIIQGHTRQQLFYVENDEAMVSWPRAGVIDLPQQPVTHVHAVKLRQGYGAVQSLDATAWTLIAGGRIAMTSLWDMATTFSPSATTSVTYDHGWKTIPADLRAVCIGLAVRTMHNPNEALSESLEAYQQPSSTAGPAGLTNAERDILRRYRSTTYAMR